MRPHTAVFTLTSLVLLTINLHAGEGARMTNTPEESVTGAERRVITDVPEPKGANTMLACLAAALQSQGEDVSYADVMGLSSRAFRLQFCWCPSAPHACCGFNTYAPALEATGYDATSYALACWEPETRRQRSATEDEIAAARAAVKASIDAGMPVLCSSEECSLIVGCEKPSEENATGWLRRPGPLPGKHTGYVTPIQQYPWGIDVVRKNPSGAPARTERIMWSLRTAVKNATTNKIGMYAMGFAGYERWIKELDDPMPLIEKGQEHLDKFDTNEDALREYMLGNAWCYESLIDARQCAAKYLRSVAGEFSAEAAGHLKAAADAYDKEVTALTEGAECFTLIAPYPWMKDALWSQALRDKQAARLRKALEHDREAIGAIAAALKTSSATD